MENFYIIAFQRSGTTLLSYLLDAHPEIVCIDEFELSKRIIYKQEKLLKDLNFDSNKKVLNHYKVETSRYLDICDSLLQSKIKEREFL